MEKRWWVWVLAALAVLAVFAVVQGALQPQDEMAEEADEPAAEEEEPAEETAEPVAEEDPAEETEPAAEEEAAEADSEPLTREEELEARTLEIIEEDLDSTSVNEIKVNYNAGLDDGSYLVLPHLVWDVQNSAGTTRDMLEMYADHLAASLAEEGDISEITVFWEVPYHLEGDNVAKFNYTPAGDGMAKGDIWFGPELQD
jgi:hypothetical protein